MAIAKDWDYEDAMTAYASERSIMDLEPDELAEKIVREHAPLAALSLAHLSVHSADERIRFNAARYIVDATLEYRREKLKNLETDPLAKFMDDISIVEP